MRRGNEESGAAALEFAILAPLIFMLIFGMLFGALAWNAKQGLSHASREAARYAATLPLDGAPTASCTTTQECWLKAVADHAVNSAEGQLGSSPGEPYDAYGQTFNTYVCVAYVKTGETFSEAWGSADGISSPAADEPCLDDGIGITDDGRVQVHIAREQLFQAVLVGKTLVLQSVASARHEILE